MSTSLITASEAALTELTRLHHAQACPGPAHCPTAAAIASLEIEIAKAKRAPEDQASQILRSNGWQFNGRYWFHTTPPREGTLVTEPEATYGGGVKVEEMDGHDVADAILRAHPRQFMPSAHRLCVVCESILPADYELGRNRCRRCE